LNPDLFEGDILFQLLPEVLETYDNLMHFGPFPEPMIRQHDRFCTKWHQDYASLLIQQDLRDISRVVELDKIENLFHLIAPRLMSPLTMPNLGN
jgi:hypothetical protein